MKQSESLPTKDQVSDTELRMLIGDMEAHGKARSITQNWMLAAFRELQERRKDQSNNLCISAAAQASKA